MCSSDLGVSIATKMKIFNAVVIPSLLHGGECWTVLDRHLQRLEVFHMSCLRLICGATRRERLSKEEILARCVNQPSVAGRLRRNRLRW